MAAALCPSRLIAARVLWANPGWQGLGSLLSHRITTPSSRTAPPLSELEQSAGVERSKLRGSYQRMSRSERSPRPREMSGVKGLASTVPHVHTPAHPHLCRRAVPQGHTGEKAAVPGIVDEGAR
eukprot:212362-Chlamydomonas_euryale.AAC.2